MFRIVKLFISVCFCLFVQTSCCLTKGVINPLQFGLREASTGEERYYVLQRTYKEARKTGVGVSYAGIKRLDITIPEDAQSLPLTKYTDFAGVTINVENNQKDFYLFSLTNDLTPVYIGRKEIEKSEFKNNPLLGAGCKLLVITDKTPWVEKRIGYDYGATRKDIMLVKDGEGSNHPVQSYCTSSSSLDCCFRDVDDKSKIELKNVFFERSANSTHITRFVKIENQYNVELSNISIVTPEGSGLYGDRAIYIVNCADVSLSDININGTYSLPNKYGYGVSLNNVYDIKFFNMYARGNWGVFGTNNVHKAYLKQCDINRFDIHCYGKDISFEDCNFVDLYNQFSSVYGNISFKNCTFTGFTPILIGSSYNAYTAFDVSFEKCTFNLDKKHNSIIDFSGFTIDDNSRTELKEKCLPNVSMIDCKVNLSNDVKKWYVFNTKKVADYNESFHHISNVKILGLSTATGMEVFSKEIKTTNQIKVEKNECTTY